MKYGYALLAVLLCLSALFFLPLPVRAETVNLGEILNCWIRVDVRPTGASFSIQTANYSVIDESGFCLQSEATASVDNTSHYVYGLVNTTFSAFTADQTCYVKYRYYIGSETRIYYKRLEIKALSIGDY